MPARKKIPYKKCPVCGKEKTAVSFYKSASPLYADDERVPICSDCVKKEVCNPEDGTINIRKLKTMCQRLDKPFYVDSLDSAYVQQATEHGYSSKEDVARSGKDIIGKYFKNIMMRQDKDKSFADSEKEGFVHQNSNRSKYEKKRIADQYLINSGLVQPNVNMSQSSSIAETQNQKQEKVVLAIDEDFEPTQEMIDLFGDGYLPSVYKKMSEKYEKLKLNYSLQTNLHQEALATYVRFKVQEELATANGNVDDAKKWYDAAQNAADKAKLTPKQLTQADLQGGINSFSEIFKAVEQAVDVIPILPQFKYRPNDACDFIIWCYINYARDLQGLPQCDYEDVYKFYDKKKAEYISQYGDPYNIFDDDPTENLRESIKKFITLPKDYEDGDGI